MGIEIRWSDAWGQFRMMPVEMKQAFAIALDDGESNGFERWLKSRSPRVQVEILDNAPEQLREHLRDCGALSPLAAFAMEVKSDTKVVDRRFSSLGRNR